MRKIFFMLTVVCALNFLGINSFASPSLYTSITSTGTTAGGVRYDFGNGFVVDGTLGIIDDGSGLEKTTYHYFADIYYGVWGLAIGDSEYTNAAISLMYAIEQPITDKITVGIGAALATYEKGKALGFFTGYDIYAVLALF